MKMTKKGQFLPLNFESSSQSLQEWLNEAVLLVPDSRSVLPGLITSGCRGGSFQVTDEHCCSLISKTFTPHRGDTQVRLCACLSACLLSAG